MSLYLAYRAQMEPKLWAFAGLSLGLLAMTRPEGVAVAGLLCLGALLAHGGAAWRMGVVAGAIVVGMEVFRWSYYGALVPNTFMPA